MNTAEMVRNNYLRDSIPELLADPATRPNVISTMQWVGGYAEHVLRLDDTDSNSARRNAALRCLFLSDKGRTFDNALDCVEAIYHLCHISRDDEDHVIKVVKGSLINGVKP